MRSRIPSAAPNRRAAYWQLIVGGRETGKAFQGVVSPQISLGAGCEREGLVGVTLGLFRFALRERHKGTRGQRNRLLPAGTTATVSSAQRRAATRSPHARAASAIGVTLLVNISRSGLVYRQAVSHNCLSLRHRRRGQSGVREDRIHRVFENPAQPLGSRQRGLRCGLCSGRPPLAGERRRRGPGSQRPS